MFPDKHFKDLESSEKRSNLLEKFGTALIFLTGLLFLGPLIHELGHLIVLELKSCSYLFNIGFELPSGIHAEISPQCAVKPSYLVVFYSAGYLLTLSSGVLTNISGSLLDREYSSYLKALGTGMLLSVVLTIGFKGDIQNALKVMNLSPEYGGLITLLIVLGVLAASLQEIGDFLNLERKE